jgi:peptide/nickel transport system permease protein
MGILVIGAFLTLIGNLLADIGYAFADPRIRHGRG